MPTVCNNWVENTIVFLSIVSQADEFIWKYYCYNPKRLAEHLLCDVAYVQQFQRIATTFSKFTFPYTPYHTIPDSHTHTLTHMFSLYLNLMQFA